MEAKPTIYIETSIISYLAARPSSDIISASRQALTARWWDEQRHLFKLYTSELVVREASAGDVLAAARRCALLDGIPVLEITGEVVELARRIIEVIKLPPAADADGYHMAAAVLNGIDYLMTWNFRHIANVHFHNRLTEFVESLGYAAPLMASPEHFVFVDDMGDEP